MLKHVFVFLNCIEFVNVTSSDLAVSLLASVRHKNTPTRTLLSGVMWVNLSAASLTQVFDDIDPVPATWHLSLVVMSNQVPTLLCLRQLFLLLLVSTDTGISTRRLSVT